MKNSEREDIDVLLARHFAEEPLTESQNNVLGEWIRTNAAEYGKLQKLLGAPVRQCDKNVFDAEKAWEKIESRLESKVVRVDFRKKVGMYLSAAASLAVVFILAVAYLFVKSDEESVHYANSGTLSEIIILPDGSEVTLYPNSSLAFSDGRVRNTVLEGKAFFRVKKDNGRSFKVKTDNWDVEVLGTSFLVDAVSEENNGVFVESGRVRVLSGIKEVILHANEKVYFENGNMVKGIIDDPEIFFSNDNMFIVLKDVSLSKAVEEIENRTGIRIELGKGVGSNRITTKIDIRNKSGIAAELSVVSGCRCDTVKTEEHYRLYYE